MIIYVMNILQSNEKVPNWQCLENKYETNILHEGNYSQVEPNISRPGTGIVEFRITWRKDSLLKSLIGFYVNLYHQRSYIDLAWSPTARSKLNKV